MPYANTQIMNLYLKDFAKQLANDVHALLVMDGAGWHNSKELKNTGKCFDFTCASIFA